MDKLYDGMYCIRAPLREELGIPVQLISGPHQFKISAPNSVLVQDTSSSHLAPIALASVHAPA